MEDGTDWLRSIVRNNLMNAPGYAPYCGDRSCQFFAPRTTFKDDQFECICGFRTEFPAEFIEEYKEKWEKE